MDPIDGVSSLARLLRGRVATEKRSAKVDTRRQPDRVPERTSLQELEKELKVRLKQIEAAASDSEIKSKVVLESVLVWEFGDEVRNEPKFNLLVAKLHQHVNGNEKMKQAFSHFIMKLGA